MTRKRGFTLIELLVVIAIIAILAAILFPVFAQAREAARTSSCLSNTKQLNMGVQMYIQDYDETFFAWTWGYYCNGDNQGAPRNSSAFWSPAIYPYVKNAGVYRCPDDVMENNDAWATCSDDGGRNDMFGPFNPSTGKSPNPNFVSYAISENLMAWFNTADKSWHPVKLATIAKPANYMLFADSEDQLADVWSNSWPDGWSQPNFIAARVAFPSNNFGNWDMPWQAQHTADWFITTYGQANTDKATRHHGGGNLSYVDGHSKYRRWTEMTWQNLTIGQ